MATKRELQDTCVDDAERFFETYDVRERLADWPVTDNLPVTGIDVGADERFRTRFDVGPATDSQPMSFSTRASTADFAVWLDTGHTYDEFADGALQMEEDHPVRYPLVVAEVVGEDYTQQQFPSTSEQPFDEADSPYVCRTNLPSLRHRLPHRNRSTGLLLISDFEVEHVDGGVGPGGRQRPADRVRVDACDVVDGFDRRTRHRGVRRPVEDFERDRDDRRHNRLLNRGDGDRRRRRRRR